MKKISAAHRAAIERLSLKPGKCPRCEADLLCVKVETWQGPGHEHPPLRFGCPTHDVWIGFCFDDGSADDPEYPHGLFEAVLRDVADPAWQWLPERVRPAAVVAGFGVGDEYPRFRVTAFNGRSWATDRRVLLDIGPDSELSAVLARYDIEVTPSSRLRDVLNDHLLDPDHVARLFSFVAGYLSVLPASGPSSSIPGLKKVGSAFVADRYIEFVETVYPHAQWWARHPLEPVCAKSMGVLRAFVMPVDLKVALTRQQSS